MASSKIHERLREVLREQSCRGLAQALSMRAETVRRYMRGAEPSAQFLSRLTTRLGLNVNWLLSGHGPVFLDQPEERPARSESVSEAMRSLASAIDEIEQRLFSIERMVTTGRSRVDADVRSEMERRIALYDDSDSDDVPEKIVMRLTGSSQVNSLSA